MESQYKVNSNGGIESGATATTRVANKRNIRGWDLVLRFSALALSLAAAVVLGVDKETTTVSMTFFVVANAIACAHAAISLLLTLANRGGNKGIALMVVLFDLVMVALLFSGIGAALAIGLMGYEGNSHVQWKKVCNVFDKFCDQAAAAMGLSGAASVAFFLLVVLATLNLHKKH
ncbi:UNVERIFIED_CONTAM: CASP-like protein 1E2 [Sesamum radiatum]|uniref:CASP-like protein n=1 Tax=Sesamum radiatum TaxID=300843 RepID=A0AAW2S8D0_SESRA